MSTNQDQAKSDIIPLKAYNPNMIVGNSLFWIALTAVVPIFMFYFSVDQLPKFGVELRKVKAYAGLIAAVSLHFPIFGYYLLSKVELKKYQQSISQQVAEVKKSD